MKLKLGGTPEQQADLLKRLAKQAETPPVETSSTRSSKSIKHDIDVSSENVKTYFHDSKARAIRNISDLHVYVDRCIEWGYVGIDTETTGLDRTYDTIVGCSLYYPGEPEVYIPNKHIEVFTETPYKGQITYEEIGSELQRMCDGGVKFIFANADFDLAMIYKDYKVDLLPNFFYDVILAWRCIKENERDNTLKGLYNKYVLKGAGDPKKFSDFFKADLFPYAPISVAMLYAANDARITYELYEWQLPYITEDNPKCKQHHLEAISRLVWQVEFQMVAVCQELHRYGMYLDLNTSDVLYRRYSEKQQQQIDELQGMVQDILDKYPSRKNLKGYFENGKSFNFNSIAQVAYLLYDVMGIPTPKGNRSTDKSVLSSLNLPVTKKILQVRSMDVLMSTFIKKLPKVAAYDGRVHGTFKSVGADTGRMSSAEPNMQNIPSKDHYIRHMFRATPGYVMLSSDYSQQEPKITAFVSQDPKMIDAFKHGRDIYATIASLAFNLPYENCLEFHPETHEYQPDGKARRSEAKTIVLGICYGRSVVTIADQLFGTDDDMTSDEKIKKAQNIYDAVLNAFPNLRTLMLKAQSDARTKGYVETILGRRRHIPDMQLPPYEFRPMAGYVNPDIDPLDPTTLSNASGIPDRVIKSLEREFSTFKYYGQAIKRMRELEEQKIKVYNNTNRIQDATRQCVNSIVQGSAAEMTKLSLIRLQHNPDWKRIGGKLLTVVHDEVIAEVPIENWKEGGEILSRCMSEAGDFLPFPINCDVTTTLRWYGLAYPCVYEEPENLDNLTEEHIKWLQYMLIESEYVLPVYPNEDGSKPIGDAAEGINGIDSEELRNSMSDYMKKYKIDENSFIKHIKTNVIEGVIL